MKRLPTTLEKLQETEAKLEEKAVTLRRERDRILRQRNRLEQQARIQRLILVGQLVENVGLPIDDFAVLKGLLLRLLPYTTPDKTAPGDFEQVNNLIPGRNDK